MNNYHTIKVEIQQYIATITLNRPEVHNAFNSQLINELYDCFSILMNNSELRVIILTAIGKSFCAGADLNWMKSVVNYSYEQNLEESNKLADLMFLIFTYPIPVIARINGSAIGGGIGLMSVCDILIAEENSRFGLSEVRLGLVPAVISPYVISRIGLAKARELFITGERITAEEARRIGLVNYVVNSEKLDTLVKEKAKWIAESGPEAVKTAKQMILKPLIKQLKELNEYNAQLIANLRLSEEGQEGMNAFLEKRKPIWIKEYL